MARPEDLFFFPENLVPRGMRECEHAVRSMILTMRLTISAKSR
jgi:hypothetical protein